MLHLGSALPHLQTLDQARKACQGQTPDLAYERKKLLSTKIEFITEDYFVQYTFIVNI
jgi:hypothetical protein